LYAGIDGLFIDHAGIGVGQHLVDFLELLPPAERTCQRRQMAHDRARQRLVCGRGLCTQRGL
jgi:hypothetical protein